MDYTGKFKPDLVSKHFFYQSKINEFRDHLYGFSIDENIQVDSVDVGNLIRFSNHAYQDISQEIPTIEEESKIATIKNSDLSRDMANCRTVIVFNGYENSAFLLARRNIEAGEELLFDYNYERQFDWLEAYNTKFMTSAP